ncbi:pumilio homolog 1-like [Phragmites australis]|uniref:pumilio homolog 1-like n=1 Tax=Phragmites australis TaxID=29695 RepID=UPI002D7A2965|nr:pumilio homolog 1-like [Phragmites australis]
MVTEMAAHGEAFGEEAERDFEVFRSGSAPPTVEGAMGAAAAAGGGGGGSLFLDDELRADPAYQSYYYSNAHLNPRLPPPLLSKEDWRSSQHRLRSSGLGGIGDGRRQQPAAAEGTVRLPGIDLGRQRSFSSVFQEDPYNRDMDRQTANHNSNDLLGSSGMQYALHCGPGSIGGLHSGSNVRSLDEIQNNDLSSNTYASILGSSLSRSASPDPELVRRAPSPSLPPIGVKVGANDKKINGGSSSFRRSSSAIGESDDLVAALSGMNLSSRAVSGQTMDQSQLYQDVNNVQKFLFDRQGDQMNCNQQHSYKRRPEHGQSKVPDGYSANMANSSTMRNQINAGSFTSFDNLSVASGFTSPRIGSRSPGGTVSSQQNLAGMSNLLNYNGIGSPTASASFQTTIDPAYIQYLAQIAASCDDPLMNSSHLGSSYMDLLGPQKVHLSPLLQSQKQYGYYGNLGFNLGYAGSPLTSPVLPSSPIAPGSPLRHGERSMRFPSGMRNFGSSFGSWNSGLGGKMDANLMPSLLEEFKSNKSKSYELSEIAGHVVEFSADQYGSRFIQQKLETASTEEKDMVFSEIMPQALTLMTDVFGNYVVQKFFEHGSTAQIKELAGQLIGRVLALSLQMYGCRVIQKAIEVVDLDLQTKMVAELEGQVMRCVRDQNGNHVIQKCIECIPQHAIEFIVSTFYGQVVILSTHPYGCRVIQRVLEHCDDPKTQQIMMDEILQSVCLLAQDQYGNYVVQHVLEHGKPHERSAIIEKLIGQIVQMSQQKFASNVIEKCLAFGNPVERQVLIGEMLGSTNESEPLEVMMKDQFANYVVQKVLETCDDQQREMILTRIKTHLNTLKKYTYGKHIVARVEKLVAAGEKRLGLQPASTTA